MDRVNNWDLVDSSADKILGAYLVDKDRSVLDELAASRQFDTIAVQPHLLFEGRLFQAILRQTAEASERSPSIQWIHSEYLGPDPLVAEAIAGRVREG